jgi:hypothetical protein
MSAHTPGPWPVDKSRFGTDHYVIGTTPPFVAAVKRIEDARLIAAAPELLCIAREFAAGCAECNGTGALEFHGIGGPPGTPCPDCADVRAVIAKAVQP